MSLPPRSNVPLNSVLFGSPSTMDSVFLNSSNVPLQCHNLLVNPDQEHRKSMDYQQLVSSQLLRVEEDMEVAFSNNSTSRHSSGFEGSSELIGDIGPEPSPPLSNILTFSRKCAMDSQLSVRTSPLSVVTQSLRHQSLPVESIDSPFSCYGSRRQSSPGRPPSNDQFIVPVHKLSSRSRCRPTGCPGDVHPPRLVLGNGHPPIPSPLEPIPQRQELSVSTANMLTTVACSQPYSPNGTVSRLQFTNRGTPTGAPEQPILSPPCCACRLENPGWSSELKCARQESISKMEYTAQSSKSSRYSTDEGIDEAENTYYVNKSGHRGQSIPGAQWARDLLGRFRFNSASGSSDSIPVARHSIPGYCESNNCHDTDGSGTIGKPDTIDPKRLPKTSGPASICLEFAKKPLHSQMSNTTPIPCATSRNSCPSSALKSSSWKPRKNSAKVRWLSQSISEDPNSIPRDCFFASSSSHVRLSCSAVEEFQCAVDILANGTQSFLPTSSATPQRTGIRVKRASESDRFLVISKSSSETKESSIACSFGQFDQNHVYSTLFRHSTCYDVLPDSGKLVILDSRLGVVRAIRALLENGVQAAPIWHSSVQRITSLFSQDLAVYLLASLCLSSLNDSNPSDGHIVEHATSGDIPRAKIADGLRRWGSQQLCDVLHLFNTDLDSSRSSVEPFDSANLFVTPQTRLKDALCRLLHFSHRPNRLSKSCPNAPLLTSTSGTRSTEDPVGFSFPTDEPSHFCRSERHSDRPHPVRQISDPSSNSAASNNGFHSSPLDSSDVPLPSPTHLIVINPTCGNVLGVLNADRLLAYLRLRLDELSCSPKMLTTVDNLVGLRWTERQWSLRRLLNKRTHRDSDIASGTTSENLGLPDPVLHTGTSCLEALCAITAWLPHLPVLPVVNPNEGACTVAQALIGLISPGDLLHFFLSSPPDVAVGQPIGKILETKLQNCRFQQDCVCHTQETLVDVLDRMFHLRTPCLVLFDGSKSTGRPIGMVTAKDLLRNLVTSKSRHHHSLKNSNSFPSESKQRRDTNSEFDSPLTGSSPVDTCEDDVPRCSLDQIRLTSNKRDNQEALLNSSSSDESVSSGSTCSAPSDSDQCPTNRSRDMCSCSCHLNDHTRSDGACPPSSFHFNSRMSLPAQKSVSEVPTARRFSVLASHVSVNASSTRVPPGNTNQRSSVAGSYRLSKVVPVGQPTTLDSARRRAQKKRGGTGGDEDDAMFSMD